MIHVQFMNHKRWLSFRRCILCGDNTSVQVAHVRMHDPRFAKPNPGMGTKDHRFMLSMCSRHHDEQTKMAESKFWQQHPRVDPHVAAAALLLNSGDDEEGDRIVEYWNGEWRR